MAHDGVGYRGFEIYQQYIDDGNADMVKMPVRATDLSAGYDLHACEAGVLLPGERKLIPTGVTAYMKPNEDLEIRPRSGLALKYGVTVLNSPGTVDADYYGKEIKVLLINHGTDPFEYTHGDRIAQAVFGEYLIAYNDTPVARKRDGGFGSTGN